MCERVCVYVCVCVYVDLSTYNSGMSVSEFYDTCAELTLLYTVWFCSRFFLFWILLYLFLLFFAQYCNKCRETNFSYFFLIWYCCYFVWFMLFVCKFIWIKDFRFRFTIVCSRLYKMMYCCWVFREKSCVVVMSYRRAFQYVCLIKFNLFCVSTRDSRVFVNWDFIENVFFFGHNVYWNCLFCL